MCTNRSLTDYLIDHKLSNPISFHMPGHKGRGTLYGIYGFGDFTRQIIGSDITEIPGADALQQPRSVIRKVMDGYRELYGTVSTELLVNGSTAGLMAAIMGSVPVGKKLLMGRNSHRSVYGALRLGGIEPAYIMPELDEETGLELGLDAAKIEKALISDPDISAVLVTSPNYYGVLSDIERIANIVHFYGKILIVDQAHGAHLKFFDYLTDDNKKIRKQEATQSPDGEKIKCGNESLSADCRETSKRAAENCGADLVIDSTHKTLLSFTGSAILNICTERPNPDKIGELLRMLQTTSPSYLLMGSLDINQQILRMDGYNLIKRWKEDIEYFYKEILEIPKLDFIKRPDMDLTKINISFAKLGLDGDALAAELRKRNIWIELTHGDFIMLMTGIGNERGDYEELLTALREISAEYSSADFSNSDYDNLSSKNYANDKIKTDEIPTAQLERQVIPDEYENIPIYAGEGRVLYEPLIPYPPGSPVACPGEILSNEVIRFVQNQLSLAHTVIGVDEEGHIKVSPVEVY